jgi:hypothetical protein
VNGKLYRVADRDTLERLRATGARIVHRFPGGVVLRSPLDRGIEGVTPVETPAKVVIPERVRAEEIAELAFAIRQTQAFRARKARRPDVGESMDDIIAGRTGKHA